MPQFQVGDDVAHKSDKNHRMTVLRYTGDGNVVCRWREKDGFRQEEFVEAELVKRVDEPQIGFGIQGGGIDDLKW